MMLERVIVILIASTRVYLDFPVADINFLDMLDSLVARSIGDCVAKKFAVHCVETRWLPSDEDRRRRRVMSRGDYRFANRNCKIKTRSVIT